RVLRAARGLHLFAREAPQRGRPFSMNNVPLIPTSAPFDTDQRLWLNGFLAGLFSVGTSAAAPAAQTPRKPLVILFGSQTGTAENIAKKTAKEAETRGFAPKLVCMEKHDTVD